MVNYEKTINGESVSETPYFCDDNEIILCGHEYFGNAFELETNPFQHVSRRAFRCGRVHVIAK
jgi:hypothetical protein